MKRKWIATMATVAAAGTIIMGYQANAQPGQAGPGFRRGGGPGIHAEFNNHGFGPGMRGSRGAKPGGAMFLRGLNQLDLTDAQESQLKDLRVAHEKEMAMLRAELQVARIDLREVMQSVNPSASMASTQVALVNGAMSKILETSVAYSVKARNVLTSEQQEQLRNLDLRPDRGGDKAGRRGARGFRGNGNGSGEQ